MECLEAGASQSFSSFVPGGVAVMLTLGFIALYVAYFFLARYLYHGALEVTAIIFCLYLSRFIQVFLTCSSVVCRQAFLWGNYFIFFQRNPEKVDVWMAVTIGLLVLRLVYFIIGLLSSSDFFLGGYLFGILPFFYTLYCLWVVKAFRYELEQSGETVKLRENRWGPGYTIHPI